MKYDASIEALLAARFPGDSLISLATAVDGLPSVRTVDACYADGAFHIVTHARSGKMRQIALNPVVGVCGDWFTGHGTAENLGHVLRPENAALMEKVRAAFAGWYGNGHVNEADPDTILLRVALIDGVLFCNGTRYEIDFI